MNLSTSKYYACVSEFAEEMDSPAGNAFLNTVMRQYYNEADAFRRRYYKPIYPKFTVWQIYRCYPDNMLLDDRDNLQTIAEKDRGKFIEVKFDVDEATRNFINKISNHGIKVSLEPNNLVIYDKEKFESTHDESTFKISFMCKAVFWNGVSYSVGIVDDENSISDVVQKMWKNIRIKSMQCYKLNQALRLKIDTGIFPRYDSWYRPRYFYEDEWL